MSTQKCRSALHRSTEPINGKVQPPVVPIRPGRVTNKLKYLKDIVLPAMLADKNAWPFHAPVDTIKLKLPYYFQVVKFPMDLGTVKKRLENRYYQCAMDCILEINLIFANCYTYNPSGDDVVLMGEQLEKVFHETLAEMPKVEMDETATRGTVKQIEPQASADRRTRADPAVPSSSGLQKSSSRSSIGSRFPVTPKPTSTMTNINVPQRASVIVYAPSLAVRVLPPENTSPPLPVQQPHWEKSLCNPASEQPYTVYGVDRLKNMEENVSTLMDFEYASVANSPENIDAEFVDPLVVLPQTAADFPSLASNRKQIVAMEFDHGVTNDVAEHSTSGKFRFTFTAKEVARMAGAHVNVTRVDIKKFQPSERPVSAKTRVQQIRDDLRLLELQVENEQGLKPLEGAFPINRPLIDELKAKYNDKSARKAATALLAKLYSPLYVELHKRTATPTKRPDCEDVAIPLPGNELEQIYDALHKIIPASKTDKKVDREIRDALTQRFNVCSKKNRTWLRKYKSLKEKLKEEMDNE